MDSAAVAEKCFLENRNFFGDARAEPEKFNLYQGLANLASAVSEVQDELRQLRQEIAQMRHEISQLER